MRLGLFGGPISSLLLVAEAVDQVAAMGNICHVTCHGNDLANRLLAVVGAYPPSRIQPDRPQVWSITIKLVHISRQIPPGPPVFRQTGEPVPEGWVPLYEQVEHLAERVDGIACWMELPLE